MSVGGKVRACRRREALEEEGKMDEILYWMRSGSPGSSLHQQMAWAGDQNVNWEEADGMPSTITAGRLVLSSTHPLVRASRVDDSFAALSLGLSGMGRTHFDVGGYTTFVIVLERSKELLLRSAEYAAFTPVMRTHEGGSSLSLGFWFFVLCFFGPSSFDSSLTLAGCGRFECSNRC